MERWGNYERESWVAQTKENSARQATAWGTMTTTGTGTLVQTDVIEFGLSFFEQPMFAYGYVLTNRTDWDPDDPADPIPLVPESHGFVYEWKKDARGLWVGAHVAVSVTADLDSELEHHFTFMGKAMKDIDSGTKLDG